MQVIISTVAVSKPQDHHRRRPSPSKHQGSARRLQHLQRNDMLLHTCPISASNMSNASPETFEQ